MQLILCTNCTPIDLPIGAVHTSYPVPQAVRQFEAMLGAVLKGAVVAYHRKKGPTVINPSTRIFDELRTWKLDP